MQSVGTFLATPAGRAIADTGAGLIVAGKSTVEKHIARIRELGHSEEWIKEFGEHYPGLMNQAELVRRILEGQITRRSRPSPAEDPRG